MWGLAGGGDSLVRTGLYIDFPVNVRVQRCKFTHPDTFRSPENLGLELRVVTRCYNL